MKNAKRTPTEDRHARFVAEFLIDLNATKAYRRVYNCSQKVAEANGPRLLGDARVAAAVAAGKAEQLSRADLSATRVLEEMRRLAFTDTRSFFDDQGNLKPFNELTAEQGSALAGFEVIIKNAKAGDGVTDEIHKIKLWDKPRTLEMLAKHFKLLTEVIETESLEALFARLDRGRERNATRKKSDE